MVIIEQKCKRSREHFFTNRIVPIWNELPEEIWRLENLNKFKNFYDKFIKTKKLATTCELNTHISNS